MISVGLVLMLMGQVVVEPLFDSGAIVGRVCRDLNGDQLCNADEPGIEGAQLLLETGHEVQCDELGRFHVADVLTRAPDARNGGRLLPGRHRMTVDTRTLPGGSIVYPKAQNVEVPMGGAAYVDFAVAIGEERSEAANLRESPRLGIRNGNVTFQLRLRVSVGAVVRVQSEQVPVQDGIASATVLLLEAQTPVSVAVTSADGTTDLYVQQIDTVRRPSSWMVVPRPLKKVGSLRVARDRAGGITASLPEGSVVNFDDTRTLIDGSGRFTFRPAGVAPWPMQIETVFGDGEAMQWNLRLSRPAPRGVVAVGLLDLEGSLDLSRSFMPQWSGRGAGSVRGSVAGFELAADLDFRDTDLDRALVQPSALAQPRLIGVFERQLDVRTASPVLGDDSATVARNPAEGLLRFEVKREGLGRLGYGPWRAWWSSSEVGRFHRALQAGYLNLSLGDAKRGLDIGVFASPGEGGTTSAPAFGRSQAHERFESTGGSVFSLRHTSVVQGSEAVRIELRDATSGLPLKDLHLQRSSDYAIDAVAGRIVLSQPLSFFITDHLLKTQALSAAITSVLVVDYEFMNSGAVAQGTLGGQVSGRIAGFNASAGFVQDGAYRLARGALGGTIGPVWLGGEFAYSTGLAQGVAWSRDGGLSFLSSTTPSSMISPSGIAFTVRARGKGLWNTGGFDVSYRFRQANFQDTSGVGALSAFALRAEQPFGKFVTGALVDVRDGADPRTPFESARNYGARVLGGYFGWQGDSLGVRLEVRDAQVRSEPLATPGATAEGGRLSVGLQGSYRITPRVTVLAGYRQRVWQRGAGEGSFDDSFASVGLDATVTDKTRLALRGGWGPSFGPLVWGGVSHADESLTRYGLHSFDLDAPSLGERRVVTGARQTISPESSVFVEDLGSVDVSSLRIARAVGVAHRLGAGFSISARYERGARLLIDGRPDRLRDAGGLSLSWDGSWARAFLNGETRIERGVGGPLQQWFATGGGELFASNFFRAYGRMQFLQTSQNGVLTERSIDGIAAASFRFSRGSVVARYVYQYARTPTRVSVRNVHLVSLLPALTFSDRFTLSSGGHVSLSSDGLLFSASLRPSVRVVGGLEVAAEVARRSAALDGGELTSVRGEVGYRFEHVFIALGYSLFGFSGTGIDDGATASRHRVFLRAEVGY